MRTLSTTAREAIYAQQTDEVFLTILEITHDDIQVPIRIVNDYSNIVSNGNTYTAFPFQISLPKESEEISRASVSFDNVSRELIDEIRSIETPPSISLSIILADSPDTIEVGPFNFILTNATYNQFTIQAELNFEDILNQNYPADTFTPQNHPGLFR